MSGVTFVSKDVVTPQPSYKLWGSLVAWLVVKNVLVLKYFEHLFLFKRAFELHTPKRLEMKEKQHH